MKLGSSQTRKGLPGDVPRAGAMPAHKNTPRYTARGVPSRCKHTPNKEHYGEDD